MRLAWGSSDMTYGSAVRAIPTRASVDDVLAKLLAIANEGVANPFEIVREGARDDKQSDYRALLTRDEVQTAQTFEGNRPMRASYTMRLQSKSREALTEYQSLLLSQIEIEQRTRLLDYGGIVQTDNRDLYQADISVSVLF